MNIQIYIIYLCCLFLAYFLSDFSKGRMVYALLFVFSLMGAFLAVFQPAEIVTGTLTTVISPTVSISEFVTEPLLILNTALILIFVTSAFMSLTLWMAFENSAKAKQSV